MRAPDPLPRHAVQQGGTSSVGLAPYLMTGPAFALLAVLIVVPICLVIATSFTDWQIGAGWPRFVGLATYRELLADADFQRATANTIHYALIAVPATTILGLVAALMIAECGRIGSVYRLVLFMPSITTLAAMSVAWQMLLSPTVGGLPQLLHAFGVPSGNWLQDRTLSLPILAVIGVWSEFGFATLFFLAGLKSLRLELGDAMALDGGGLMERVVHVVLPHLAPITLFVVAFTSLKALRVFDTIAIITRGGPEKSTLVILYYIYEQAFSLFRTNVAAAATVLFILVVCIVSVLQLLIRHRFGATR